jgi:disulfide bond formation protein DsbB
MLSTPSEPLRSPAYRMGGLVLLAAAAVIVTALGFEHIGGYDPCPLCLQQRYAYYAAIPALFVALVLVATDRANVAAVIFLLVALAFLANAGLGIYQAGAEWKWWEPPATCAAPSTLPSLTKLPGSFDRVPVNCGVASWRFLGLSFAGWNVVTSALLAAGAAAAALIALRNPR